MNYKKITFVGAGNMTRSIIAGLVASDYPAELITATNPSPGKREELANSFSINTSSDNIASVKDAEVVVLAVKPQIMQDVANELKQLDLTNKLIISIAAGIKCQRFNEMFGQTLRLVRVMPNTPSLVGLGMSGLYAAENVDEPNKQYASDLMSAVGKTCWVEEESGINNVIAAAGSAPAYFFLFMEAMQAEAIAQGFDKETARTLVQQAALGAAHMVEANPETELSTLREQVTSKGGTTAEALRTFNEQQLSSIVAKAMRAAVTRAEEMENLF
ncbi:pyrroline-5-carboxylate reductase [Vibrio marisflavi]|uniref:Pyrroline-5-carboxylate reductase n=1 Tax=Vibrio marisflavi CECT 7928 TaxID=634439 RepID=A0ABN8E0R9_9VIBR|nr:pyrroline-5-carboxylate reductase [Vibrio marisflavi]CAH0538509.1 Pyrroline-5-carboxylate reductase [Vibrio marisflavi CECT 7928]